MNEPIRMSADDLVVLLLSSREHTTSESDARRLLAEVKDNHSAEQAAEIDRLRDALAGLRQGSERWAARCDHIAKQGLRWKAEADGRKAHGQKLEAELEKAKARVAELEKAAVEGRAALGSLCYDLEDPGTAALGALYLLKQATVWTETGADFAADALARRDADKLDAAAESIEAACPDHGVQDEAWMDCHCVAAEELNRQAEALRKGGDR